MVMLNHLAMDSSQLPATFQDKRFGVTCIFSTKLEMIYGVTRVERENTGVNNEKKLFAVMVNLFPQEGRDTYPNMVLEQCGRLLYLLGNCLLYKKAALWIG